MTGALLTTYLSDYRLPLFRLLAEQQNIEVLCYGGAERYVPPWFSDLDAQLAAAPFPARRLGGINAALTVAAGHDMVIAPFAGGAILPAAFASTRRHGRPFVLWASVWSHPRSLVHAAAQPVTRHIYRHAEAIVAYGEHVKRFVARIRGREDDIFVAPQSVEPELFARDVTPGEVSAFRARHDLGGGPLVLYVGRLVPEKGVDVLAQAWTRLNARLNTDSTLVVIGDGPLAEAVRAVPRARFLGPLPRTELPIAYAAAALAVLPSVPTPRFLEPWGLVCNEALHQGCPVIATTAVGAVAGGLVRHGKSGWVVAPASVPALAEAIERLLNDPDLRNRLAAGGREAVAPYTYEAMGEAFARALALARERAHG